MTVKEFKQAISEFPERLNVRVAFNRHLYDIDDIMPVIDMDANQPLCVIFGKDDNEQCNMS